MGSKYRRKLHKLRVQPLTPLMEGPGDAELGEEPEKRKEGSWDSIRTWLFSNGGNARKRSNLKLMLGVLGCPLAPVPLPAAADPSPCFSIKDCPVENTSSRYIIQQYLAATGCLKASKKMKSMYTTGSLKMACSETEMVSAGRSARTAGGGGTGESGCFVLWQMSPGMWLMELVVDGCKVVAGSDGRVVWRHLPWLGTHAARGPRRPLRRIIQGLDPKTTASMFAEAQCLGEKRVDDDDCFVLKVSADRAAIAGRSEGHAEVIRHVLYGYFSQRTGLLVHMEDSHLTRVQAPGSGAVYWETTTGSSLGDYRQVDGVLVAHWGTSTAVVFRFGEEENFTRIRTKMEEQWRIDDVLFDVPGLSGECFIPPAEILNL